MYPPNYDMRGVQIVHNQHLKELRAEAEAYRLARQIKHAQAPNQAAKPSLITRVVKYLAERVRMLVSANRAKPRDASASANDKLTAATAKRP